MTNDYKKKKKEEKRRRALSYEQSFFLKYKYRNISNEMVSNLFQVINLQTMQ